MNMVRGEANENTLFTKQLNNLESQLYTVCIMYAIAIIVSKMKTIRYAVLIICFLASVCDK